ncbi:hypothetical protein BB558_006548 [Smittium angustum]|uniref:alpha-1,2-Mannosidase n=1 Tax=Smittium angustum TaxID=133377 RepID=A0A2U1IXF6_SMIAN|nr:hypothetical protein BB558_006548 [Smittium angustum]
MLPSSNNYQPLILIFIRDFKGENDILGDFCLTLIDSLDTLALLQDKKAFAQAVKNTIDYVSNFDLDSYVQVFETNIRILGGLISAHIIATDHIDDLGMNLTKEPTGILDRKGKLWVYRGELLHLARELGWRLLPAFEASENGIPYARVNLRHGYSPVETPETCTAGAGTLLLEFATLSRLTNETVFEDAAKHAIKQLWFNRSKIGLVGNSINIITEKWTDEISGISAGIDSFYEYLFKGGVYLQDQEMLDIFENAYQSLMHYSRDTSTGYLFGNVDMNTSDLSTWWVDSLSAYFPGLMVQIGDIANAQRSYMVYYHLWRRYRAMPERFDLNIKDLDISIYPLRPEFIESTYFLYQATKDPFYLEVGEMVLYDINRTMRTKCGFGGVRNLYNRQIDNRMESFALSETFKYLYLLFDEENPIHKGDRNYVFTTEAHYFPPLSKKEDSPYQYPKESSFSKKQFLHGDHPPKLIYKRNQQFSRLYSKLNSPPPSFTSISEITANKYRRNATSNQDNIDVNTRLDISNMLHSAYLSPRSFFKNIFKKGEQHIEEIEFSKKPSGTDNTQKNKDISNNLSVKSSSGLRSEEPICPFMETSINGNLNFFEKLLLLGTGKGKEMILKKYNGELNLDAINSVDFAPTLSLRRDFDVSGSLVRPYMWGNYGMIEINANKTVQGGIVPASESAIAYIGLEWNLQCALPDFGDNPPNIFKRILAKNTERLESDFSGKLRNCFDKIELQANSLLDVTSIKLPFVRFLLFPYTNMSAMSYNYKLNEKLIEQDVDNELDLKPSLQCIPTEGKNRKSQSNSKAVFYSDVNQLKYMLSSGAQPMFTDLVTIKLSVERNVVDGCSDGTGSFCSSDKSSFKRAQNIKYKVYRERLGRLAQFSEKQFSKQFKSFLARTELVIPSLVIGTGSTVYGCERYTPREGKAISKKVVLIRQGGGCSFWDKALNAQLGGASAVLVGLDHRALDFCHNGVNDQKTNRNSQKFDRDIINYGGLLKIQAQEKISQKLKNKEDEIFSKFKVNFETTAKIQGDGRDESSRSESVKIKEFNEVVEENRISMNDPRKHENESSDKINETFNTKTDSFIEVTIPVIAVHMEFYEEVERELVQKNNVKVSLV